MGVVLLSPERYPLMAGGGLFLLVIGVAIMVAGAWPRLTKQLLIGGGILAAVATAVFTVPLTRPYGAPTTLQIGSLVGAVVFEVILIRLTARATWSRGSRAVTLSVLLAVAAHFVPMAIAFGPELVVLALVAGAIAVAGLVLPRLPLNLIWFLDGTAKAVCGGIMLAAGMR